MLGSTRTGASREGFEDPRPPAPRCGRSRTAPRRQPPQSLSAVSLPAGAQALPKAAQSGRLGREPSLRWPHILQVRLLLT